MMRDVGREYTVKSSQVDPRLGRQCDQLGDEVQRREQQWIDLIA